MGNLHRVREFLHDNTTLEGVVAGVVRKILTKF